MAKRKSKNGDNDINNKRSREEAEIGEVAAEDDDNNNNQNEHENSVVGEEEAIPVTVLSGFLGTYRIIILFFETIVIELFVPMQSSYPFFPPF